ncbi:MAG: hypothetical protein HY744_14750 [Deltaproteobacteria bacterium]|nr:hypothetical protein [Deltaproteobacteria bacterium]
MEERPRIRFLSLFVPDLESAARRYEAVFGVRRRPGADGAPRDHPYAAAGPVVLDLGPVELALYQCDGRTTHPGDVGIGVELDGPPAALGRRAAEQGGRVFFGPAARGADGRELCVLVLPERHFFEVVGPR